MVELDPAAAAEFALTINLVKAASRHQGRR
jgi:hypothetical protein